MHKGFTLIELLVVVLIVGILASVAWPQYERVVRQSRLANMRTFSAQVLQSQDRYFMKKGRFACSFKPLDVFMKNAYQVDDQTYDFPGGRVQLRCTSGGAVATYATLYVCTKYGVVQFERGYNKDGTKTDKVMGCTAWPSYPQPSGWQEERDFVYDYFNVTTRSCNYPPNTDDLSKC